jgi:hypothetical protein
MNAIYCRATRPIFCALIALLAVTPALPSAGASIATTGLVSNSEGTIGHGSVEPEPAPFNAANTAVQLGSHPAGGFFAGIYTLLASRDVFNTLTGAEAGLTAHPAPYAGHGTAGVDLNAFGVSGTVYYSLRGLTLNYLAGDDYNYDLTGNIESRIYRDGEVEFYYDSGGGPVVFARGIDVVFEISINWNTFAITQTLLSSTPDLGAGMLAVLTTSVGVSTSPVQITGTTTEGGGYSGAYGIFNDQGTTWGFDENIAAAVPGISGPAIVALLASLLGAGGFALRRQ